MQDEELLKIFRLIQTSSVAQRSLKILNKQPMRLYLMGLKKFVLNKEGKAQFRCIMRDVKRKSVEQNEKGSIEQDPYVPLSFEAML
jgi:hypothetical protein